MNNWQKAFARNLVIFIFTAVCALPTVAQDPPPPAQPQNQASGIQTPPLSRPIPNRTTGLEPGKVVRWTLRDAILAALEKNVDIDIERENVRLAQFDLFAAQGAYDPLTTSTILYESALRPTAFRFSGSDTGTIENKTLTYNFGLRKSLERFGSSYTVDFNNQRLVSNTNNLITQYSPSLTISFTQPLFKNFKTDPNRRTIKINKKRLDLSDALFRQRAIEIISRVQQAYWDLVVAIRDEEIQRDAVKLAETQLRNNQRQVEVGTLAPIDVVSAATQVERNRTAVFQAMNAVAQAENLLKSLTVESPTSDLWTTQIIPVESLEIQPVALPLTDALKLALENRPEIKQFALHKEMNQIDVDFFRNQAKPQIDLVATYNTRGLGGTPLVSTNLVPNCTNPIPDLRNPGQFVCAPLVVGPDGKPAFGSINPITSTPITTTAPVTRQFIGGYGTSLSNLFRNEFRTWSVGVQFSLPLRNRTAKANLGRALESGRQIELQTRRELQSIEVEVRNAVQSVETAKLRIEAARATRQYAEQQLDGEEKKLQAGLGSTFLVLTRQNELTQAQGAELRAQADYNKAVAELQRVISTTLSSNNIEVKSDLPPTSGNEKK